MAAPAFLYSYLNSASAIIQAYRGDMPLAVFLKNYFSKNKKYGSKDRRAIAGLCYAYFRLGKDDFYANIPQRILAALHYTGQATSGWAEMLAQENIPVNNAPAIFPWKQYLSETIDAATFEQSFLVQPDVFLRIRPGAKNKVQGQLDDAGIAYQLHGDTVRLHPQQKIDTVLHLNRDVVVQDYNSQRVAGFFDVVKNYFGNKKITVYDCCAASGGKSILAKDVLQNITLTVSDIRENILHNLSKRFAEAGLQGYQPFMADLSRPFNFNKQYDLVIADVPCTGSGTWARTPEQLYFFNEKTIGTYAALQQKIITHILPAINPGCCLLYITCSVFKQENEEQVFFLQQKGLKIIAQKVLNGSAIKADTMFAALLQKPIL